MAEVTRREHIVRDVLGGLALAAVLGAGAYFIGLREWAGQQIEWLGEPVSVSRWWHWLLVGNLILTAGFVLLATLAALREGGLPEFAAYHEDHFFGLVWRWSWVRRGLVSDLWCWCPRCDRRAVYSIERDYLAPPKTIFHCAACGVLNERVGDIDQTLNDVRREIELKIRNGSWKAVVEPKK